MDCSGRWFMARALAVFVLIVSWVRRSLFQTSSRFGDESTSHPPVNIGKPYRMKPTVAICRICQGCRNISNPTIPNAQMAVIAADAMKSHSNHRGPKS
jgi:hypothetical protein